MNDDCKLHYVLVALLREECQRYGVSNRGLLGSAADEIERLRAENAQLRSSLDAMVTHVSNEELARAVEAEKKRIESDEQAGGI